MGTNDRKDSNSDDAALFRKAVSDVSPIKTTPRSVSIVGKNQKARSRPDRGASEVSEQSAAGLTDAGVAFGQRLVFKRASVSRSQMRELSRGKLRIDAELDLHGLIAITAQRELANFLGECISRNLRCIRIVHGKGHGSGERGPVLKSLTNSYLRKVDAVLAFCSALDKHGGTGAVYVLLATR